MARRRARPGEAPTTKTLIGMLHLPPLPGAPRCTLTVEQIVAHAVAEARTLAAAGFDALIVENYGDLPFFGECVPPETVAAMAIIVDHVRRAVDRPIGVNVLRNDAAAALAIAATAGADFIRVNVHSGVVATDQGVLTGRAAETARQRARIAPRVRIFADVHVKHATPISQPDLANAARDTAYRGLCDGLIVSGQATGQPTDAADVRCVKLAVPDRPVWVGSGVTPDSAAELLSVADGLIVGTCLKRGGQTDAPLDPARIRKLLHAVGRA